MATSAPGRLMFRWLRSATAPSGKFKVSGRTPPTTPALAIRTAPDRKGVWTDTEFGRGVQGEKERGCVLFEMQPSFSFVLAPRPWRVELLTQPRCFAPRLLPIGVAMIVARTDTHVRPTNTSVFRLVSDPGFVFGINCAVWA